MIKNNPGDMTLIKNNPGDMTERQNDLLSIYVASHLKAVGYVNCYN